MIMENTEGLRLLLEASGGSEVLRDAVVYRCHVAITARPEAF